LEREIGKIGKRMNGKRNFIEEEDRRGRRASKKKQSFAKQNLIHFIHLCHLQVSDLGRTEIYNK
jgi:hypothetical protein